MDFARQQLKKYGWCEGKGLGKNEDGISTALKPRLKFDNYGVGHDAGEEFTNNWWEQLFNKAAGNVDVHVDSNQNVRMKVNSGKSVEITTRSVRLETKKGLEYGSFIKTSKLTGNSVHHYENVPENSNLSNNFQSLTDDELFAACGGRTLHKGARHGLKLRGKLSRIEKQENGKLSRIEKQEKMLLKKMRKVSLCDETDESVTQKKLKKLKKQKEDTEKNNSVDGSSQNNTNLKKKKIKRKTVSFNETVTKIYTVDLDTSFESEIGSIKDENSNDPNLEKLASGSDEGIELDNDIESGSPSDNHKSFEIVQCKYSDLSKAERKKLKKKRKLEAKKQTSTGIFLQRLKDEYNDDDSINDFEDKERNLKKRKFFDESDQGEAKSSSSITEAPDKVKNKKNKKKRKKQRKLEEKQMNNIVKSFDICSISKYE